MGNLLLSIISPIIVVAAYVYFVYSFRKEKKRVDKIYDNTDRLFQLMLKINLPPQGWEIERITDGKISIIARDENNNFKYGQMLVTEGEVSNVPIDIIYTFFDEALKAAKVDKISTRF